jgi:hypothetical protein
MLLSIKRWSFLEQSKKLDFLPLLTRRGLGEISKLAFSSFDNLKLNYNVPLICASRFGCWQQTVKLSEQIRDGQPPSPSSFSKMPLSTFGGIISILTKNTLPYTSITAGEKTFEMGLIETVTQKNDESVYVYAEEPVPEVFSNLIVVKPVGFSALIAKKSGDYELSFEYRESIQTKTVHDFVKFLKGTHESFATSHFAIIRKQ